MRKLSKLAAVILTITLAFCMITVKPISANAVNTTMEQVGNGSGVQEKLNSIASVYPTGSYFTASGNVCYSNQSSDCQLSNIPSRGGLPSGATAANVTRDAWSCCAFARYVFYCTFGLAPESCGTVSSSNAQIGDYMNLGSHYAIYLGQDSTYWYVYDSNYTSPATNVVKYNRALRKSNFSSVQIHHASNYDTINTPAHQYVDLGTDFYASITHLASWNHLTAEENDNVDICWDNNTANQYWKFYRYDDGSYKIKSASTGKCLEVEGGSWVNGANIQVYDDNGTDAQRWFVYKCGNGYQLKAKCTDCVMEMNAWNFYQGVNLVSGSRDGSDSEIFVINWKDFNDIGKTSLQVSCHNGIANFSWNNARCATNYNIKIWNGNSVLSGEAPINLWNVKNNNFSINLGDGTYTAYIESFNKLGDYVQSSPITFNVSTSEYRADYIKTENNHTYSIYNIPTTWEKAEEICKKLGGHLVTITSQDEQIIVNELLEYGNLSFYSIGGKRIGDSNNWEWINGEIFDFTNWATGEPNNVNNIENYLSVFNTSIKGYWNDSTNSASEGFCNGFICEVENTFKPSKIENYNGHTYSLFETSLSWENAKEFCEKSGGHLVTINDSMEQEFIENLLTYGEKELYWLGGVKEDDSFVWLDGKTITYDNYYDGEPNNYDNLESFLQISNAGTTKYKWNDNKNTPPDFSYGFIMETERIKGDVNGDGVISIADATTLQKYLANIVDFDDEQLAAADTNGDGSVSIADATQIQKYLVQLIPSLG